MTEQIDELMALADEYATAIAIQGEAHDHVARDALKSALEAALKPLEPMRQWRPYAWVIPGTGLFSVGAERPFEEARWQPVFTEAPRQQPLIEDEIEQCCYAADTNAGDHPMTLKWTVMFAREIESAHGIGAKP